MKIDKMEEAKKELIRVHGIYKNSMDAFRGYILNGELNVRVVSSHISELNILALYAWYIEGDKNKAKNYWYIAGLCAVYALKEFRDLHYFPYFFSYVTLSDNKNLLQEFAEAYELYCNNYDNKWVSRDSLLHNLILVLNYLGKKDKCYEVLEEYKIFVDKLNKGKVAKTDTYGLLKSIVENNQEEVNRLYSLEVKYMQSLVRYDGIVVGGLMNRYKVALCKYLWYLGMNIEVSHPLIPMELMPIEDMEYRLPEGYEFLKELHEKVK